MRQISALNQAALIAGATRHHFIWFEGRNRTTGATESAGLWTGLIAQNVTIDGQVRAYFAGGVLVRVPEITVSEGLVVQSHDFELANITPEFVQLVEVYDPRRATITIHEGYADPMTDVLVDEPDRIYQGLLNTLSDPDDERATAPLTVLSKVENLTLTLPDKKSDESQSLREISPGVPDRIRRYAAAKGGDWWGQEPPETTG